MVSSDRPVHGPAWPVSYKLVTQAGRCVAGPDWVGFQRVAAGLINCWVGLVRTVLAVLHGLHKYVRRIVLLSRIYKQTQTWRGVRHHIVLRAPSHLDNN